MGNFYGHAIPGTFFLLVGVWWLFHSYRNYFRSVRHKGAPYVSALTHEVTARCPRLDAVVIVLMATAGMLIEVVIVPFVLNTSHVIHTVNMQHATIYFFFWLTGLLVIFTSNKPGLDQLPYAAFALALLVEGILFTFHVYGRDSVDVLLHTLLLYVVYGSVLQVLLEIKYRDNLWVAQARAFFLILQGTWFWQIGFFLYNPFRGFAWKGPYDATHDSVVVSHDMHGVHGNHSDYGYHTGNHSIHGNHGGFGNHGDHGGHGNQMSVTNGGDMHGTMMFMACSFAWHIGAVFIFVLLTGAIMSLFYTRGRRHSDLGASLSMLSPKYMKLSDGRSDSTTAHFDGYYSG